MAKSKTILADAPKVNFDPRISHRRLAAFARTIRARFDSAATTDDNRRHWTNADDLSANASHSPAVRKILRRRARYEVANNGYAKHMVTVLGIHTIGTGPRLQLTDTSIPAADRKFVSREFALWAREVRLAGKLRLMRSEKATNGEAIGILTTNFGLQSPVTLDLQTVEADRLAEPNGGEVTDSNVDGVLLDAQGNPVAYRIMRRHPGDSSITGYGEYDDIEAARVLHWYPLDRSGQHRGVPEITPSLPLFAMLRRYTLAVVLAAEAAAMAAGVVYSDAPPEDGDTELDPGDDSIEMEKGTWLTLPKGYKLGQIQAEQPTTTYAEFKRELLKEISAPLHMPYNIAACDSSDYNFSSGQLDQKVYVNSVWTERDDAEGVLLLKLFRAWLREARLVPDYLPATIKGVPLHTWHWDSLDLADPLKTSKVRDTALRNGTATLASIYAEEGREVEEEMQTQADTLGVPVEEYKRRVFDSLFPEQPEPTGEPDADDPEDNEEMPMPKTARRMK